MRGKALVGAAAVWFDEAQMWVALDDGRTLGIPLVWYPRLLRGSPELRAMVNISRGGLHWEALDEDISIAGLLAGHRARAPRPCPITTDKPVSPDDS